jgi:hypothetical protein
MQVQFEALLYLATVIDSKHEKAEAALTSSRRIHLLSQIEMLKKDFELEYADFQGSENEMPIRVESEVFCGRSDRLPDLQPGC